MKSKQKESQKKWEQQIRKKHASVDETDSEQALEPVELDENVNSPEKNTKERTGL